MEFCYLTHYFCRKQKSLYYFVLGCAWLAGVSGGLGNRRNLSLSSGVKQLNFPFSFSAVGEIELFSKSDIEYVAATSTATKKDSPP